MAALRDALALVKRGVPVFPLRPGTKDGYVNDASDHGATADPLTIYEWFRPGGQYAGYNFGCWTGGQFIIVDIDKDHGGLEAWNELLKEIGPIGRTFTGESARGGRHLYFDAAGEIFSSADLVKGKINVRGCNGYVVGPGSQFLDPATGVTGTYKVFDPADIIKVPDNLRQRLRLRAAPSSDAGKIVSDLDAPEAIRQARDRLQWARPAIQGQSGDQTTYELACAVLDYGLTNDTAHALMLEIWNPKCDPPWDSRELKVKVDNAWNYKQSGIGRDNPSDGFSPVLPELLQACNTVRPVTVEELDAFERRIWVDDMTEATAAVLPDVEWAAEHRLIKGKICVFVAPPGLGKSTLTIQWAHALALGPQYDAKGIWQPDFTGLKATEKHTVLVINGEDDLPEMQRRSAGVREHFGIPYGATHGRLRLMSAVDSRFVAVTRKDGGLIMSPDMHALTDYVKRKGITVIVVDPLIDTHDAQENDNGEMQTVMAKWREFAGITGCAVLIVHHTGKIPVASADAYYGSMSASRGASAVAGAARTMLTFFNMSEKDAEKHNATANRGLFVRLDVAKNNHAPPEHQPQWFKRVSVQIPNKSWVGVLVPWTFADNSKADASLIVGLLWEHIKAAGELSVGTAAGLLLKQPAYSSHSKATLSRRIFDIFENQTQVEHAGQTVVFTPKGKSGGEFSLHI